MQPHLPPWGHRAAEPVEQIIIAGVLHAGRVKRPQMGIAAWIIPSIVAYGTDEQKQRFLPPTFRGEMIWCQRCRTGRGSGPGQPDHRSTKVDGGWRITGRRSGPRVHSTRRGAPCWPAPTRLNRNTTACVLPAGHEGARGRVKPLRELTGNAMFNTVFIDDVFVPDALVLGEVNRGWGSHCDT